jgi:isocitrate dehydrogenase
VQQFLTEGHLRWDSLGEFLAVAVALEDLGQKTNNAAALILAETLDQATGQYLEHRKSPVGKVHGLDNRGGHFYLVLYWAEALATQDKNAILKAKFTPLAQYLRENETTILSDLDAAQGRAVDIGGYYHPDTEKVTQAMRPSATFNTAIASIH